MTALFPIGAANWDQRATKSSKVVIGRRRRKEGEKAVIMLDSTKKRDP
jgi:hypothetical protein